MEPSWHPAQGWCPPPRAVSWLQSAPRFFLMKESPVLLSPFPLQGPLSFLQHQEGQALGKGQTVKAKEKPRRPIEGRWVLPWTHLQLPLTLPL